MATPIEQPAPIEPVEPEAGVQQKPAKREIMLPPGGSCICDRCGGTAYGVPGTSYYQCVWCRWSQTFRS